MDQQQQATFGQAPRIALWIGVLMLLSGIIVRYILGERGVNTLVPTLLGMPISMLGFVALEPEYASGAMRGVTALALLGVFLTFNVLPQLNALLLGQPPTGGVVLFIINVLTFTLCTALLLVCIIAFGWVWHKRRTARTDE
ncbi:MAG: hypothetical protein ACUVSY_10320 [Roseiflexus sp.]